MQPTNLPAGLAAPRPGRSVSRRTLLRGAAAVGLAAASSDFALRPQRVAPARAADGAQAIDWQQFDAQVQAAMQTFAVVGAAVAVVNAAGIVHSATFGVRDLAGGAPVTPNTLFRVASTTKSMTAVLLATFVDDGTLAWDQPVIELWPDFRAPTDELTRSLRVRDLMGMDSGLGAPVPTDLHQGYPTALQLLHSLAFLPVLGPPHTQFYYNNTVYTAAGYLPALMRGTPAEQLGTVYAQLMQERFYGPVGMSSARLADDPRPFSDDYAIGYALDLVAGTVAEPWAAVGSFAPVGATLASLMDMAAYVRTQLRGGISPSGGRVVSTRNLEECWKPHIDLPPAPELPSAPDLEPNLVSAGYGMGWISQTYTDGRRLVWHNGSNDGFTTFMGCLPEDDLGLVVLTNVWGNPSGFFFYSYVLNLLLSERFGLNSGVNEAVIAASRDAAQQLADLGAQAIPVDRAAIAPYLGHYENGYHLGYDASGVLRLSFDGRALRVLALPGGSYVLASGLLAGTQARFTRDGAGMPIMELVDVQTVRWTTGPG